MRLAMGDKFSRQPPSLWIQCHVMTREGIGNSEMAWARARRMGYLANAFHVIDIAFIFGLYVAMRFFDKPGWLILLALPTVLFSVGFQLLVFRAENQARDAQALEPPTER